MAPRYGSPTAYSPSSVSGDSGSIEFTATGNYNNKQLSQKKPGFRTFSIRTRSNCFDAKWWWMVDVKCQDGPLQGATLIVARCMRQYQWDEALSRRVLTAYKQFLTLKNEWRDWDAQALAPCHLVDLMWHAHVSDLNNYLHDCMLLCEGHVVDRNPDLVMDRAAYKERAATTRDALASRFGKYYDAELWMDELDVPKNNGYSDLFVCLTDTGNNTAVTPKKYVPPANSMATTSANNPNKKHKKKKQKQVIVVQPQDEEDGKRKGGFNWSRFLLFAPKTFAKKKSSSPVKPTTPVAAPDRDVQLLDAIANGSDDGNSVVVASPGDFGERLEI